MNYSVALTEKTHEILARHLIRDDEQEDLCFALYAPSTGASRLSGLLSEVILPLPNERNVHGNASFNSEYFDRVIEIALKKRLGICFLHSHPTQGWQGMSMQDIETEMMLAPRILAVTNLPLLGMTIGQDEVWSGRFWNRVDVNEYRREWCQSVRVVGKGFNVSYNDNLLPSFRFTEEFTRTISAWGEEKQADIARLKVGVVGLGSVGSIVAEALMRTGIQHITLIDFDIVEKKNLDRLLNINKQDIGYLKVQVYTNILLENRIYDTLEVIPVSYSIIEENGLKAALDCDILFSCVDKPLARQTLNKIAYVNLIPVIDGGIDVSINGNRTNLAYARNKTHTIGPNRICMECLGQYTPADAQLELEGFFEDKNYIDNLPPEHFINKGENVFAFSLGTAAMEMQQFLSLVLQPRGISNSPKEYDFVLGDIDTDFSNNCMEECLFPSLLAKGDEVNNVIPEKHEIAEKSRIKALSFRKKQVLKVSFE